MAIYLKSLARGQPAGRRNRPHAGAREQPADEFRPDRLRSAIARAATPPTARGMPPHYPPLAGNPSIQMQSAVNPIRMVLNGGFPPGTAGNPRPTACRPSPRASPTTRSRPSSPISAPPGATGARRSRRARPTRCAQHRWIEAADAELRSHRLAIRRLGDRTSGDADLGSLLPPGASGAAALAGIATADRRRDLVRVLPSGLRAARGRAMSEQSPDPDAAPIPANAPSDAGRRSRSPSSRCWCCWPLFAGVHQAALPQSQVRDGRPAHAASAAASSSKAISAARVEPDGSVTVRAVGQQYSFTPQCILVPDGHADHLPRHQRRRGARASDHRHQRQPDAGAGLHLQHSRALPTRRASA